LGRSQVGKAGDFGSSTEGSNPSGPARHQRTPPTPLLTAVRRARDLIDRDFAEPLNLDRMARAANYSKFHFARAFTDAYGETPQAYLSRRRIERAKDLLRAANLTVTEVCMVVGFESVGSFSSRFKELVGVSPSEYRRSFVAGGGAPPIPGCFVLMWTRPAKNRNREEANVTGAS
jgi:AraC-like DNA-binding protein